MKHECKRNEEEDRGGGVKKDEGKKEMSIIQGKKMKKRQWII
jgi:hypothetical protein